VRILFQPIECLATTQRQDDIQLEPTTIHLWGITLNGSSHCLKQCGEWLDERERERAARLVREQDRIHYVLSHGGLRAILSRYLNVGPDSISFDRSASGKPVLAKELCDRSVITFNLSHAHGRALIAVSNGQEVGVDLESVRSEVNASALSERYFACSEHAAIMQAPEEQRTTRFFRYWVAKEALLKAQGIGLRGLSDCEIFLEADGVPTDIRPRLGAHFTNPLRVRLLRCEKGWEAAVAARDLDRVQQYGSPPE